MPGHNPHFDVFVRVEVCRVFFDILHEVLRVNGNDEVLPGGGIFLKLHGAVVEYRDAPIPVFANLPVPLVHSCSSSLSNRLH